MVFRLFDPTNKRVRKTRLVTLFRQARITQSMRKFKRSAVVQPFLILTFILVCGFLSAQDQTSISGKVADAKGTPIPGAGVSVSNASGKVAETLTELDGSFKFEGLPAGVYQLTVEIVGFVKSVNDAVDTASNSSRSLAVQLAPVPRPQAQSAPQQASKPKQTQPTQTLEAEFQTAAVTDLPGLNQFQQELTPQATGGISAVASPQDSTVFVNGNSANMDAGNLGDPGFRDQIMNVARQMGFQMSDLNQMGRGGAGGAGGPGGAGGGFGGPGGGMGFMGMGGRGGRGAQFQQSKIEGNFSETYANSALNARNYSLTGQTVPKPLAITDSYNLTVGGALPFFKTQTQTTGQSGSGGRGRASGPPGWSLTYSGTRNRGADDVLATVPTDLERIGDFSQTYAQALVFDPSTGKQSEVVQPVQLYLDPNDPASRFTKIPSINPIANQLLKFIPAANIPCAANGLCVNNYSLERSIPSSSDQVQASVTGLRLSSKDNFGVSYSMRRASRLSPSTFLGEDTTTSNSGQNIQISGMHSFQPRFIANWRVALNRVRVESSNGFAYKQDVEGELGMMGVSEDPINWGPPTIGFTNYGGIGLAAPALRQNQNFTISGGLNKIGTKHSLRAGADLTWTQLNSYTDSNGRGTYTFTGYATALLDAQGRQVAGTGNDLADFLLGLPYSTSRRFVNPAVNTNGNNIYLRNRSWDMYITDNWRFNANLTLNYGLRYEYTEPTYEKYNRLVSLDASPGFTQLAQVFPNETGHFSGQNFSRSLVNPDRNDFAPRVGIAWRPKSGLPVVIRAGYGIGYDVSGYSSIVNQLVNQPPFAFTQNLATGPSNPLTLQNGFPSIPALTILNTFAIDPRYRTPYAQQWNMDVQAQFSRVYVLDIAYNGSKGTGLTILRAPNRSSDAQNFIFETNGGSSIYHGMTVTLNRRFSRGFNITNSYTFSKSIDDAPSSVAQNDADLSAERGLSNGDRRHNFQSNITYELPIGQNRKFFAGSSPKLLNFISGWTFNGTFQLASGTPLTARYISSNGNASGAALYSSLRPDVTGAAITLPRDERTVSEFFDTAAFAIPSGPYGTAGRNTITGPGMNLINLNVRKSFRLDENGRRIDFTWQVTNLLNHPNWAGVSTTVNSLSFGQVTNVSTMRQMTASLRVRF